MAVDTLGTVLLGQVIHDISFDFECFFLFCDWVMLIGIIFIFLCWSCYSTCSCTFFVTDPEVDSLLGSSQICFGSKKDTVYCRCCDNFDNDN